MQTITIGELMLIAGPALVSFPGFSGGGSDALEFVFSSEAERTAFAEKWLGTEVELPESTRKFTKKETWQDDQGWHLHLLASAGSSWESAGTGGSRMDDAIIKRIKEGGESGHSDADLGKRMAEQFPPSTVRQLPQRIDALVSAGTIRRIQTGTANGDWYAVESVVETYGRPSKARQKIIDHLMGKPYGYSPIQIRQHLDSIGVNVTQSEVNATIRQLKNEGVVELNTGSYAKDKDIYWMKDERERRAGQRTMP